MQVYRASRRPRAAFDPLDSSASVAWDGWRFNDERSEILYTAGVQALSILEVAARPGWNPLRNLPLPPSKFLTEDMKEGVAAMAARRDPVFQGK